MKLTIGHLYGLQMNTYGDNGNLITLKKRCNWRGIDVEIKDITYLDEIKKGDYDLYFFGGGQDQAQKMIARDIKDGWKDRLKDEVERGVPLLSICGGYQLLGEYYQPFEGEKLKGLNLFPAYTVASNDRMIGNLVIRLQVSGDSKNPTTYNLQPDNLLVGFENHSGKTYLKKGARPLGKVIKGFGNNGENQTEGCIYKNAIGCYLHGSLLPKNPAFADWLIKKALETKYEKDIVLDSLDDRLEQKAHAVAIQKFS